MRRFAKTVSFAAVALAALNATAVAHPGHPGGLIDSLAHPFAGLDHILATVAVVLMAVVSIGAGLQARRPLMCTAGGAIAALGVLLYVAH